MINLTPDLTAFIMWVYFMVALMTLDRLVFRPTFKILDERKRRTGGLKADTEVLTESTKRNLAIYEQKIAEARLLASKEREKIILKAREEEKRLIDQVRKENEELLEGLRGRLAEESAQAKLIMRSHTQELAQLMVDKLLEREAA